jgi:BirA family biotin operon repressor/biotin-[acetyl-CoA-carboxylase] ligase
MAIDGRSYSTMKVGNGTTVKIEYRDFASSTTEIAKEYALLGYPDKYVIFTEYQATTDITETRLKNKSLDKGIFMSILLRPSFLPAQAAILGPLSISTFTQALESYTTKKLGISWVSDIFCDGIKIGGTQIEGKLKDSISYDYIIVTFAARIDEVNFPPRIKDSVKRIFEKSNLSTSMMMAKTVLDKFFIEYSNFRSPEKHIKYYSRKFALTGAKIKYLDNGKLRHGTVTGIDEENLALIVETRKKTKIAISKPSSVIIPSRIKISKKKNKVEN